MSTSSEDLWPWKEPKNSGQRGAFIVVEGLDRAGKTTQVKRLCDKLYSQDHNIKTLRFPGDLYSLLFNSTKFPSPFLRSPFILPNSSFKS